VAGPVWDEGQISFLRRMIYLFFRDEEDVPHEKRAWELSASLLGRRF